MYIQLILPTLSWEEVARWDHRATDWISFIWLELEDHVLVVVLLQNGHPESFLEDNSGLVFVNIC